MVPRFDSHQSQPLAFSSDARVSQGQSDVGRIPTAASMVFNSEPTWHTLAEPSRRHRVSASPRQGAIIFFACDVGSVTGLPQFTHTTCVVLPSDITVANTHSGEVIGM